jgi:hypothetical protein
MYLPATASWSYLGESEPFGATWREGSPWSRTLAKRKQPAIPPASPVAEATAFWQEYVRQANEMLAMMQGECVAWWIYSVSLRTFELVIGEPSGKGGNVVLSARGCQSIAGPTRWTMRAMEVIYSRPGNGLLL